MENTGPRNPESNWHALVLAQYAQEIVHLMGKLQVQQVARRWSVVLEHTRKEMAK